MPKIIKNNIGDKLHCGSCVYLDHMKTVMKNKYTYETCSVTGFQLSRWLNDTDRFDWDHREFLEIETSSPICPGYHEIDGQ